MVKLSIALATRNEEHNIAECLNSVKSIADEIIVVDEESTDKTVEIARNAGAKVYIEKHEPIFHITKQKAIDKATGEWILQLDADERVTKPLADEVRRVINMTNEEILGRKNSNKKIQKLFDRHQRIINERDGVQKPTSDEVAAFYLPRINMFIGKPLVHAGVYPDGVIRLFKKDKAKFPAKDVHEQLSVNGKTMWLFNNLEHHDSPTIRKYLERLNRYTDLHAMELKSKKASKDIKGLLTYLVYKPSKTFVKLFFRHRGYKDGIRGFLWSVFSATHFPIAYFKYYSQSK